MQISSLSVDTSRSGRKMGRLLFTKDNDCSCLSCESEYEFMSLYASYQPTYWCIAPYKCWLIGSHFGQLGTKWESGLPLWDPTAYTYIFMLNVVINKFSPVKQYHSLRKTPHQDDPVVIVDKLTQSCQIILYYLQVN